MIFKMWTHKQSVEKWNFSTWEGSSDLSGYGPDRGRPFANAYDVWSTSVIAVVSDPADRQRTNEWHTDRMTERTITELHEPWPSKHTVDNKRINELISQ